MIALREQPAGSHAPMVLNYSRCVVLGSGPAYLGTAYDTSGAIELLVSVGMAIGIASSLGARLDLAVASVTCKQTNKPNTTTQPRKTRPHQKEFDYI